MKQKDLADLIGYTAQHVSNVKVGLNQVTKKFADRAEKATGISALKWLYPDRYGDPWVELETVGDRNKKQNVTEPLPLDHH